MNRLTPEDVYNIIKHSMKMCEPSSYDYTERYEDHAPDEILWITHAADQLNKIIFDKEMQEIING